MFDLYFIKLRVLYLYINLYSHLVVNLFYPLNLVRKNRHYICLSKLGLLLIILYSGGYLCILRILLGTVLGYFFLSW